MFYFSVAGGGSTATTFLIGIFGICAIKFDCKELLIVSYPITTFRFDDFSSYRSLARTLFVCSNS